MLKLQNIIILDKTLFLENYFSVVLILQGLIKPAVINGFSEILLFSLLIQILD